MILSYLILVRPLTRYPILSKQTQCVVCGHHISAPIDVISGVPQGTVLGPLLFLLYQWSARVYYSFLKLIWRRLLYRKIESAKDFRALQCDLSKIETWTYKWLMTFNTTKCEVLQITLNNNPIQGLASYYFFNHKLLCVAEAKYLGITLDSKLTINKHVDVICKKANSVLFLLKKFIQ